MVEPIRLHMLMNARAQQIITNKFRINALMATVNHEIIQLGQIETNNKQYSILSFIIYSIWPIFPHTHSMPSANRSCLYSTISVAIQQSCYFQSVNV